MSTIPMPAAPSLSPSSALSLRFIPIFEDSEFISAAKEYEQIWNEEGGRILEAYAELTGLSFIEKRIAIVVYEGISMSGRSIDDVMKLRASYESDDKKGTLVHELGHRLIAQLAKRKDDIDEHQTLFLFLYDVWVKLWGKGFADKMVGIESNRKGFYDYEKAWAWASEMSAADRAKVFAEIKGLNSND